MVTTAEALRLWDQFACQVSGNCFFRRTDRSDNNLGDAAGLMIMQ
jgi:hypothetical protein